MPYPACLIGFSTSTFALGRSSLKQTKIESVQRSFTKRLPYYAICHTQCLEFISIDRLEIPRLRYDLVFVYEMLFGLVDLKFSDYFTLRAGSTTRGHDSLFLTYSRLNVRKHFFCERIVPIRSNPECNIIDFSSIMCHGH